MSPMLTVCHDERSRIFPTRAAASRGRQAINAIATEVR